MTISIVIGIVKNDAEEIFITRRHNNLHQGGFWEFAGGKVEQNETLKQALVRELKEEIGIDVLDSIPLIQLTHCYEDRIVTLNVFEITKYSGEPKSLLKQESEWVTISDLKNFVFPAANKAILTALRLPKFYAILNDDCEDLLVSLQHLLNQGITLIQARLKNLSEEKVLDFLDIAYPICERKGALLLVNSGILNAIEMPSDGIHLTSRDLLMWNTRPENTKWLSASCHNLEELEHAQKIGVDFVLLSPVLKTQTHLETMPMGWEMFEKLVNRCNVPVYALGGLQKTDLENARLIGAQGICGISAFF